MSFVSKKQSTRLAFANVVPRLKIWIVMAVVLAAIGLFQSSSAQDEVAFGYQHTSNAVTKGIDFDHRMPMVTGDLQRTIDAGMHIENIYNLNLKDKSFWAEGWFWSKWRPEIQEIIDAEKIQLSQVLEFTNEIEATSMVVEPDTAEPVKLDDGSFYQLYRFSGQFFMNDLELAGFPFYDMNLAIILETRPDALSCYEGGPPCVSLMPDNAISNGLVGQFADINGYDKVGSLVKPFTHQYNTNFGIGEPSAFPSIDFGIVYKTNLFSAFAQYIMPLLVVIGIVIASPSLPGSLGDVRLAIPTTALLTLIFLQQTYRADLPPLSYTTFLDMLYIYAYLVSFVFFLLFCWSTFYFNEAAECDQCLVEKRIGGIDWKFQLGALISLALLLPLSFVLF